MFGYLFVMRRGEEKVVFSVSMPLSIKRKLDKLVEYYKGTRSGVLSRLIVERYKKIFGEDDNDRYPEELREVEEEGEEE